MPISSLTFSPEQAVELRAAMDSITLSQQAAAAARGTLAAAVDARDKDTARHTELSANVEPDDHKTLAEIALLAAKIPAHSRPITRADSALRQAKIELERAEREASRLASAIRRGEREAQKAKVTDELFALLNDLDLIERYLFPNNLVPLAVWCDRVLAAATADDICEWIEAKALPFEMPTPKPRWAHPMEEARNSYRGVDTQHLSAAELSA